VNTSVDQNLLEDMDTFIEDFEVYIETQLELPDGTADVTDVTIIAEDRDNVDIAIDFTITLTDEELGSSNFTSEEDVSGAWNELQTEIQESTVDFIYGCSDELACNYDPAVNVDTDICEYPDENFDCAGNCIVDVDCNGDCGGSALIDGCEQCSGGNTEHNANSDQDCNGDCFGLAIVDDCGACSEGETGYNYNEDDLGCGCFLPAAIDYYFDEDGDGLGNGDPTSYCLEELPDFWVENSDDLCPFDPENDADGDGICGDMDICPGYSDTVDSDGDDIPDGCDAWPNDDENDEDGDGACGDVDVCEGCDGNNDTDNDSDDSDNDRRKKVKGPDESQLFSKTLNSDVCSNKCKSAKDSLTLFH
jgi:hypothetical protein